MIGQSNLMNTKFSEWAAYEVDISIDDAEEYLDKRYGEGYAKVNVDVVLKLVALWRSERHREQIRQEVSNISAVLQEMAIRSGS